MSTTVASLWPSLDEIGKINYLAPIYIMRQQAEAVSQLTSNILEGQVISENVAPKRDGDSEKIKHTFILRASALDGLKTKLFEIKHDLPRGYPLTFETTYKTGQNFSKNSIGTQREFEDALLAFFHSEPVKEVLQSLIAQSTGPEDTLTALTI